MRVIIDTDPGLGLKYADVDDGLALFLMLNNPYFEVEGITTVFGNSPVNKGFPLAKYYLKIAGQTNIPCKKGAARASDLGCLTEASSFLVEKVKENPNELTLFTLGPFTNIATALEHYPSLLDDLKQIVIMGGTLSPLTVFNKYYRWIDRRFFEKITIPSLVAEFNSVQDPRATKKVLEAPTNTPRVQMGLEMCCRTVIREEHIDRLRAAKTPISEFITQNVPFWLKMWKLLSGRGGFYPFDTCVPIYTLNPGLFKTIDLHLDVDIDKLPGKLSIRQTPRKDATPLSYCIDFMNISAKHKFMDILLENLEA